MSEREDILGGVGLFGHLIHADRPADVLEAEGSFQTVSEARTSLLSVLKLAVFRRRGRGGGGGGAGETVNVHTYTHIYIQTRVYMCRRRRQGSGSTCNKLLLLGF